MTIMQTRGFTLIELMIVIVIIGILAAVAVPKFLGMSKTAHESEADPLLKQGYSRQHAAKLRQGRYVSQDSLVLGGWDDLRDPVEAVRDARNYLYEVTDYGLDSFCIRATPTQLGRDRKVRHKAINERRQIQVGSETLAPDCVAVP
jgi:prepilin-type N-terminal cleavage/methylation domain-containing protein